MGERFSVALIIARAGRDDITNRQKIESDLCCVGYITSRLCNTGHHATNVNCWRHFLPSKFAFIATKSPDRCLKC